MSETKNKQSTEQSKIIIFEVDKNNNKMSIKEKQLINPINISEDSDQTIKDNSENDIDESSFKTDKNPEIGDSVGPNFEELINEKSPSLKPQQIFQNLFRFDSVKQSRFKFSNQDKVFNEPNAKDYLEADSSTDGGAVRFVKKIRKNRIKMEKIELKNKIKNSNSEEEKVILKEQYKFKFSRGLENNTDDNIIELRDVNKYYFTSKRFEKVIRNFDLKIPKGKFVLILGPSGSGKTTLLNVISGLDNIDSGDLIVANHNLFYLSDNKRIKFRADNLSFIFQSYNLISTLTVEENIKIGENLRSENSEPILIKDIINNLGLETQASKYPYQLSGGQQQRVSIARALAKNPEILFADEPTGALDEERGKETIKLLMDINKKYNTTLIIVTHNPNFEVVADIVIKVKDGKLDEYKVNNSPSKNVDDIKWG